MFAGHANVGYAEPLPVALDVVLVGFPAELEVPAAILELDAAALLELVQQVPYGDWQPTPQ